MTSMVVYAQAAAGVPWEWITVFVAVLGEVLAVIFVVRVLASRGTPAGTLLWMVVILAAPWLGLALYYLLPRRIQTRRLLRRREKLQWLEGAMADLPGRVDVEELEGERGEDPVLDLLRRLTDDGVRDDNAIELLESGADFFEAVTQRIAGARHFVHLETYILRPDAAGIRLFAALTEAAARGVQVRVLYDSFGSWGLKRRHFAELEAAGGKVVGYLPLLWRRRPFTLNLRNHRKLFVIDGEIAWLGGRNVGDEYARDRFGRRGRLWLDAMVAVRGPAVPRLHRVFVEDWYTAAGEDLARPEYFPATPVAGPARLGMVIAGPDTNTQDHAWVLFQMLAMARSTVEISSPYVVPTPELLQAMLIAAARGVRVRIYSNGPEAEAWVLYRAKRAAYRRLLEVDIELWETTGGDYNHAKFIVVDGRSAYLGSANWDARSAALNFEIGIVTSDPGFAESCAAVFEQRVVGARRVTVESLPGSVGARVAEGVCRILSPLL